MSLLRSISGTTPDTGTPPVRSQWPRHEPDEIAAVTAVLESGRVNALLHGEQTRALASEFAAFIGATDGCGDEPGKEPLAGICLANGTVSLEVGLKALGIGPGDEVVVPARSFFASASCVLACGAMPVFADVDPLSQNIDPTSVERVIGPRTRAILCVHLAGWPCDMDALLALCRTHGLFLVEDCAQAHGAHWRGQRVGSFGDISSFSFCTDKIMSTGGEGGLLLSRSPEIWRKAWSIKDHGKDHARATDGKGIAGEFRYIHVRAGTNARMTEMQAAIGRRQLAKLPRWLAQRKANLASLRAALEQVPGLILPQPPAHAGHAGYKAYVLLEGDGATMERRRGEAVRALLARGIPAAPGSCPDMSREPAFDGLPPRRDGDLPQAAALGARSVMLPCDHTLHEADMIRMARGLQDVLMQDILEA